MTVSSLKTFGALTAIAFAAGAILAPSVASALDFKGKTVTAVVPFKEGGGTDKINRMFAPFWGKHLPGQPKVIVRNMPGGASIRGNNWFHNSAKPDGLTIMGVSTSSQTGFTLGGKKVKYDLRKWRYILATPRGTVIYSNPSTGIKGVGKGDIGSDIKILRKHAMVTGAKNPTSAELRLFLAMELLGIKNVKAVFGLSTGKQRKALIRGELNINYDSGGSYLKKVTKYVKSGKVIPLMVLGYTGTDGKITKDPGYPNFPNIIDAYKAANGGKHPKEAGVLWDAYKNFYSMGVMTSKGMALPPKTPKKIVALYIKTAKKIIKDKKFWKIAKKKLGQYPVLFGLDAKKAFSDAVNVSPEVKAFMKKFVKEKFDANI